MTMKNNSYRRKEEGSAYIEAAIVFPILFALIFGIIDFSRVIWADANITNALADAARSAEVLNLTGHDKRAVIANVLIKSLKRYRTPVSSLYCNLNDNSANCARDGFAKIRMEWIDGGNGLNQAIQGSHTVQDAFYSDGAEGPTFDNNQFGTLSWTFGAQNIPARENRFQNVNLIGISVMFRPECKICKFLLGGEVQFRRSIFVPYSGSENPFFSEVRNGCTQPVRTCLVNVNDGTLQADNGVIFGTCVDDDQY